MDAFLEDYNEQLDTDSDGTGNNADTDGEGKEIPGSFPNLDNVEPYDVSAYAQADVASPTELTFPGLEQPMTMTSHYNIWLVNKY